MVHSAICETLCTGYRGWIYRVDTIKLSIVRIPYTICHAVCVDSVHRCCVCVLLVHNSWIHYISAVYIRCCTGGARQFTMLLAVYTSVLCPDLYGSVYSLTCSRGELPQCRCSWEVKRYGLLHRIKFSG